MVEYGLAVFGIIEYGPEVDQKNLPIQLALVFQNQYQQHPQTSHGPDVRSAALPAICQSPWPLWSHPAFGA